MRRSFTVRSLDFPWVPVSLAAIVAIFALASWQLGPTITLFLFTALCGTGLVGFIAYRHPRLTVILVFITGSMLDGSGSWLGYEPGVGSIRLRFFDPILLGMVLALSLKLFLHDKRSLHILIRTMPALGLLIAWLMYIAVHSIPNYGFVKAFGEFRTYHQFFIIALYVAVFFPTRQLQWRLFKLLLVLSFLLIPWGLISIPFRPEFSLASLGTKARFISSYLNLSLLWGVISLYIVDRQRLIKLKGPIFYGLILTFAGFTLINNHRSVWMATLASLALLLLFRRLSSRRQLQVGIGVFIALIGLSLAPNSFNEEIGTFIQERSAAFTDAQSDDTASWRLFLWQQAIEAIKEHPFQGVGLGQNFQLTGPFGDIITTSPHNQYLTLGYHGGVTALVIYLFLIASLLLRLRSKLLKPNFPQERAIYFTTLMIIMVVSLYYMAYTSEVDFMTWLFIGLGIGALSNRPAPLSYHQSEGFS